MAIRNFIFILPRKSRKFFWIIKGKKGLEAADKIYKLGNSRLENIEIRTIGWNQDLLL